MTSLHRLLALGFVWAAAGAGWVFVLGTATMRFWSVAATVTAVGLVGLVAVVATVIIMRGAAGR